MSIKVYDRYTPRANVADANYTNGSFKNESVPGANDGTPVEVDTMNDYVGFTDALLSEVGVVATGNPDTVLVSQRLVALKLLIPHVGDDIYLHQTTVAELASGEFSIGTTVNITDRSQASFKVVAGGSANGFDILNAGGGNTAVLQWSFNLRLEWLGGLPSVPDNTGALSQFRDLLESSGATGLIGQGEFSYITSPNFNFSNLYIEGEGSRKTILKCTGSGRAFNIDPGVLDLQFRYNVNLKGFTVEGNALTPSIVYAENIAACKWDDIDVREGNSATGVGFDLNLVVSCEFRNLYSGINAHAQSSVPSEGIRLSASPTKLLNPTDNVFINMVCEGSLVAGLRLLQADSNTFIGGTCQSNTGRGALVSDTTRMNTFTGVFFENNAGEDVIDSGRSNQYSNCSSSNRIVFGADSRLCIVNGGLHERLEVQVGGTNNSLLNLEFNGFASGSGGIFDSGTNTSKESLYDFDTGTYFYDLAARQSITVTASPFTYKNESGHLEQILVRGGTISSITWIRGGDTAIIAGGGEGANANDQFLLAPNDEVSVNYSVAPTMNAIPMNVLR